MSKQSDAEYVRDRLVPILYEGARDQLRLLATCGNPAALRMTLVSLDMGMLALGIGLAQKYPEQADLLRRGSNAASALGGDTPLEVPERVIDRLVDTFAEALAQPKTADGSDAENIEQHDQEDNRE